MALIDSVLRRANIDKELLDGWLFRHHMNESQMTRGFVIQSAKIYVWMVLGLSACMSAALIGIPLFTEESSEKFAAAFRVLIYCGLGFAGLFGLVFLVDHMIKDVGDKFAKFLKAVNEARVFCNVRQDEILTAATVKTVLYKKLVRISRNKLRAQIILRHGAKKYGTQRVIDAGRDWEVENKIWQQYARPLYYFHLDGDPAAPYDDARKELTAEEISLLDG